MNGNGQIELEKTMNQAELYEKHMMGQYENGLNLVNLLQPKSGEVGLDIGCGTGKLTYALAKAVSPSGKMFATDPDAERLQVAKNNLPDKIKNINWFNQPFSEQTFQIEEKFDFIFSNYVFHWIPDPLAAIKLAHHYLKEKGRFGFCVAYKHPSCMTQALHYAGDAGQQVISAFKFMAVDTWLEYFDTAGFDYVIDANVTPYYYADIDEFLVWLEATSHGVFKVSLLSETQINQLRNDYKGELYLHHDCSLRLLATKRSTTR